MKINIQKTDEIKRKIKHIFKYYQKENKNFKIIDMSYLIPLNPTSIDKVLNKNDVLIKNRHKAIYQNFISQFESQHGLID